MLQQMSSTASYTPFAIGIHLGTTYSWGSFFTKSKKKFKIIVNDHGNRMTPSMVAFTDTKLLVGDLAKSQIEKNPTNTVFDFHRLIGRLFDDPIVQENIKHWPFDVVKNDRNGKPMIRVQFKKETKRFAPEEIVSMVLGKLKKNAEAFLNSTRVTNAVITVPDHFDDAQRQAIKDAATNAGFYGMVCIISENVAIPYCVNMMCCCTIGKHKLVFYLGSRTLQVFVWEHNNSDLLKKSSCCTFLGGKDFDGCLVEHFVEKFKCQYQKDISTDKLALFLLQTACERAKQVLSVTTQTPIEVEALFEGIDFSAFLTRAKFEELCSELFLATLEQVKKTLSMAKLDKSQIDEIVLVGGSTHIPKIQALLKEFFGANTKLNKKIRSEEIVAFGAAMHASSVICNTSSFPKMKTNNSLNNVTPFLLGVCSVFGVKETVIEINTILPVQKTISYSAVWENYQTSVLFRVYVRDQVMARYNYIGELKLPKPEPKNRSVFCSVTQCDITFKIADSEGTLEVTAQVTGTVLKNCITISKDIWWPPLSETANEAHLVREAEQKQLEDENLFQQVSMEVHEFFQKIKKKLTAGNGLEIEEKQKGIETLDTFNAWLNKAGDVPLEKVAEKLDEIEAVCSPLLNKLDQNKDD